jgi:hypothetical protein
VGKRVGQLWGLVLKDLRQTACPAQYTTQLKAAPITIYVVFYFIETILIDYNA